MTVNDKLAALRLKMNELDAWIVPGTDPHQSEYIAERWQERRYISGFSGSAGQVVITRKQAILWTDSRYYIQSEKELSGSEVELFKSGEPGVPSLAEWLRREFPERSRIGVDGRMMSVAQIRTLKKTLPNAEFVTDRNLLDSIWTDRPGLPDGPVEDYPLRFAGESRVAKIERIRTKMKEKGADHHLISTLDDIAWTFNLRGNDILDNPVFIAFALITPTTATLFVDPAKLSPALENQLTTDGITLQAYNQVEEVLDSIPQGSVSLIDPQRTGYHFAGLISRHGRLIEGISPAAFLKAIKNETEIAGIRRAHEKHGVAMVKFFRWLETYGSGHTEWEVSQKLESFRVGGEHYRGPSFTSIVGYNANGALPHYTPKPEQSSTLHENGLLVVDTGGQYLDGTIDMTRTVCMGDPTIQQRADFTAVLKGHIGIAMMEFIHGTNGVQIDAVCRKALWRNGLSYGHGTGHGVGCYLSVHEGPQSISPRAMEPAFEPGMLTSNEPGVYREGEYGIRTENLVLTVPSRKTPFGEFYRFETITLFPIERRLIDRNLLTSEELDWLNEYHRETYRRLCPYLTTEERDWLSEATREL